MTLLQKESPMDGKATSTSGIGGQKPEIGPMSSGGRPEAKRPWGGVQSGHWPGLEHLRRRRLKSTMFRWACAGVTFFAVATLAVLLYQIAHDGLKWLSWDFLNSFPSRKPEESGIKSALVGSVFILVLTAAFSIPIGVGAAVYLEEFTKKGRLATFIEINISNLAGVPSIVFGLLGLFVFVRLMHLPQPVDVEGSDGTMREVWQWLPLGRSVLAGALTMTLVVLPVVIIAAREAIRSVPDTIRQAAYGLGATQWQTVRHHVLPASIPGILTGVILAMSRAIGETAPLVVTAAGAYVAFLPTSNGWDRAVFSEFTVLPVQIFNWASRPQAEFHELAAAGILVLMATLLVMNSAAIVLRQIYSRRLHW